MAFKGTLKEFNVPDILQMFSLQKKSGVLTFTSADGFITLILENGLIVGVDAFPKKLSMRVGNVLVKQDLISEEMLQRALSIQKRTNQKLGEILSGMGLIGESQIREALRNQAEQIVLSLFKWKKGEYNFKVMENLDPSLYSIDAMPTDGLIMEGVQMMDEWPLIRKEIPNNRMVFEPAPLDIQHHEIEIIKESEDEPAESEKIFLSESEANLLKYINGRHTVQDLVDLGGFTEYKVYKCLYRLINKSIIRHRELPVEPDEADESLLEERKSHTGRVMRVVLGALLLIILVFFASGLWTPYPSSGSQLSAGIFQQTPSSSQPAP
ncbi:MAG: DUF4388 domain-containing protein [Acidobacteriota bacterium]|jgi:hypothetical protein|nr:DUF4388 domain-containing protein [Acidobacteriota bacterium]